MQFKFCILNRMRLNFWPRFYWINDEDLKHIPIYSIVYHSKWMNVGNARINFAVGCKLRWFHCSTRKCIPYKRNYVVLNETCTNYKFRLVFRFVPFCLLHFLIAIIMFYQFVLVFCKLLLNVRPPKSSSSFNIII